MQIPTDTTLLFIGDSITSAGRNFDAGGEGHGDGPYGDGYVRLIKALLESGYPERRIRIVNKGVGGHTIRDLAARWDDDVLAYKPEWLSVKIGINDVWRQFDCPLITDRHVYPEEFEATYRNLLDRTRPGLKGLVLASPYLIHTGAEDAMRRRIDEYVDICETLAREYEAIYVPVQKAFDDFLAHWHANRLCHDRIHPNSTGHMIIARAWLNAVGFSWTP